MVLKRIIFPFYKYEFTVFIENKNVYSQRWNFIFDIFTPNKTIKKSIQKLNDKFKKLIKKEIIKTKK